MFYLGPFLYNCNFLKHQAQGHLNHEEFGSYFILVSAIYRRQALGHLEARGVNPDPYSRLFSFPPEFRWFFCNFQASGAGFLIAGESGFVLFALFLALSSSFL